MYLYKVLFRPVRGGLYESLREVVSFDNLEQFVDYFFYTFHAVPHLRFHGFDERINWNTYVALNNVTWIPMGYVHVPYNLLICLKEDING